MSFTCDGRALIETSLYIPEAGAYRARVEVDGQTAITGQVDLELPGVTFKCTVRAGGDSDTRIVATLAPGKGTLPADIGGQSYFEATPRTILRDTVGAETLNADLPEIADQPIARWVRIAGPADDAVSRLAKYLGLSWWFEPDGTIKIGTIAYPETTPDIDIFPHDSPEWKRLNFASDEVIVMPRTTVNTDYGSYRVTEVRYWLRRGLWRGTLYYA